MEICADVCLVLCFQYTFGNINSIAFLLVSKLNILGYLADFHPAFCSVSICVQIQTYPNNPKSSAVYIKQAQIYMIDHVGGFRTQTQMSWEFEKSQSSDFSIVHA